MHYRTLRSELPAGPEQGADPGCLQWDRVPPTAGQVAGPVAPRVAVSRWGSVQRASVSGLPLLACTAEAYHDVLQHPHERDPGALRFMWKYLTPCFCCGE